MGKQGPCCHCGVTTTPLWRNGPPDKPVLCNACGSRWRTKGSLTNYIPLHAYGAVDERLKVSKAKSVSFKPKEKKLIKIKQIGCEAENIHEGPNTDQNFRKVLELDTSNRSSSGSAISYSESCARVGTTEASDLTGSAQSIVWEPQVPSKKRTCVPRSKPSSLEKLSRDLCSILHEHQSSYLSSTEEDLLYDSPIPTGSIEIGNGSVLLRYPSSKIVEEESEASSLPNDNTSLLTYESYSGSSSFPPRNQSKGKSAANAALEHTTRDNASYNLHILRDIDSPLGFTDLKDVVNLDVLTRHMTNEEQQKLMKLLPPIDTAKPPESLLSMFKSSQFTKNLDYFQQLLQEGIFDLSNSAVNGEEYNMLRRYVLQNLTSSSWVGHYKKLKDAKCNQDLGRKEVANEPTPKRYRDIHYQRVTEPRGNMRSPKSVSKSSVGIGVSIKDFPSIVTPGADEFADMDGACLSPRSFFGAPPDHDLLLDLPDGESVSKKMRNR